MSSLPDGCVDAIVTDPPYGLSKQPKMREVLKHWLAGDDYSHTGSGFMGKSWDSFVPGPLTWEQAYRVLKPGGYCAVFAGSRTVDLMATSLRLAGFEVVDMLHWMYGSGFPKSMDISKAIDAKDATDLKTAKQYAFTNWFTSVCDLDKKSINKVLGVGDMARHYTDVLPSGKQPAIATREHLEKLRPHIEGGVPEWVEQLVDQRTEESENTKARKVVGQHGSTSQAAEWRSTYGGGTVAPPGLITTAHTDEAKQWEGWGTALKPCHEPIILCRKPLDGTYANNILAHGVGALNIDGCRNGERWPGNVLHDGCLPDPMDRYFYCAKASSEDRHDGCGNNPHPTVKPTELMQWLCRLVTPPGGMVLDPFTGSGSTGRGAVREGFDFLGFEMSEEYAAISRSRIDAALD